MRPLAVDWKKIKGEYLAGLPRLRVVEANPPLTLSALEKRATRERWTIERDSIAPPRSSKPMPAETENSAPGQSVSGVAEADRTTGQTPPLGQTENGGHGLATTQQADGFDRALGALAARNMIEATRTALEASAEFHVEALAAIKKGDWQPGWEGRARTIRHHEEALRELGRMVDGSLGDVQIIVCGRVSGLLAAADREKPGKTIDI